MSVIAFVDATIGTTDISKNNPGILKMCIRIVRFVSIKEEYHVIMGILLRTVFSYHDVEWIVPSILFFFNETMIKGHDESLIHLLGKMNVYSHNKDLAMPLKREN